MCAPDRKTIVPLVTLAAVAPACMLTLQHAVNGAAFGLSADFWKGAAIGVTLGLQVVAVALLLRARSGGRGGPTQP